MMGTYKGRIALILGVPKLNIGPMHHSDMASGRANDYQGALHTFRRNKRLFPIFHTPQSLIEATIEYSSSYNELLVVGSNLSKNTYVSVKGIIVQCLDKNVLGNKDSKHLDFSVDNSFEDLKACLLNRSKAQEMRINHLEYLKKLAESYPIILMNPKGYQTNY